MIPQHAPGQSTPELGGTPRFRVGNQTAFSSAHPLEPFRFALDHGFDAFEWFSDRKGDHGFDWATLTQDERDWIRREAQARDLHLAIHAPWQATPFDEAGRAALRGSLDFAADIGAGVVVLHLDTREGATAFAQKLAPLVTYASARSVRLALENTVHTGPADCNRIFEALRALGLGAKEVGMCLDIGHANVCAATRNDYLRFVDAIDSEVSIIHGHFHENWGDGDHHLLLFTGPAAQNPTGIRLVLERLAQRGFDGVITLEVWPNPPELLIGTRDRLIRLAREAAATAAAVPVAAAAVPVTAAVVPTAAAVAPTAATAKAVPGAPATTPVAAAVPKGMAAPSESPLPKRGSLSSRPPESSTDFQRRLMTMNGDRRSWRRRLEWVRDQLVEPGFRQDAERLSDLAIYLRFVGTGAVACSEDGGHYRPSHHAALAFDIERLLLGEEPKPALAVTRRLLRWLPSHDSPFRRAEPLTRIRDIAHRGDIPRDLKEEIKNTLQNKLHRSAGPEDLQTSARILAQITEDEGRYSSAFVEEFKIFHRELEDFFNAPSLERNLASVAESASGLAASEARKLRAVMGAPGSGEPAALLHELSLGLSLRQEFSSAYSQVGDAATQRFRLLEQQLEERAFVVLSQIANRMEQDGWSPDWAWGIRSLAVGSEHLALSGLGSEYAIALAEALAGFPLPESGRENDLRLLGVLGLAKSILTRVMDELMGTFGSRVEGLGRALGVDEERIAVYVEGEIRGSLTFQLSRVVQRLTELLNARVGGSPWEAIVLGSASGQWIKLARLQDLPGGPGPWVVSLDNADGDESIPASVKGLLLLHDLPILSHLAIRARQGGVVLASARGAVPASSVAPGQAVVLQVTRDKVELREGELSAPAPRPKAAKVTPIAIRASQGWIEAIGKVERDTAGPKAYASRGLAVLSERPGSGFQVPPGWVVPFGVMEAMIHRLPEAELRYASLLRELDQVPESGLAAACQEVREWILGLEVPTPIGESLRKALGERDRWVVRSSGNLEDLAGFSAAGLYDSVVGVLPESVHQAIPRVWASLHSERAVRARREVRVLSSEVHMAVLVQRLVPAELSFVMYTKSPWGAGADYGTVELAAGLGEILCSATGDGTPLRVEFNKSTGDSEVLSYPSYPEALRCLPSGEMGWRPVRYQEVPWVREPKILHQLVKRLAGIAGQLEEQFGCPQDVEGAVVGETVYLVQSRPAAGG